ncbi:family 78 glycoside hydrolase catalytic domain [Pedobacter nyackensis]|uniref:family 78 glycoside hydrolase catalytic domain n=1 Tax=Pedobacter nyackensis TaxID=475255 RepID=UPI002930FA65|nr:family 78 glycoside hydrolase catalytic domain [Pedobacter nyackensis]
MKPPILLLILVMNSALLFGQQPAQVDAGLLNQKWKAHWITYPKGSLKEYGVYHFRKTISLNERPKKFVINVSGDNRYVLYVNGKEVCRGPARGDLGHWRFETFDIAAELNAGTNVLAAVVWNFGEFKPLAQMSNRTGFIVQGNSDTEQMVNTGEDWKVYKNEAYVVPAKKPARTVVGPGDEVDASKYPYGWEGLGFNDKVWLTPRLLSRGVPYGKFEDWDWMLVPRNIPFMEHTIQRMGLVRRAEQLEAHSSHFQKKRPLTIGKNKKIKLLLDQGQLTTAYPQLLVSGGKGASIRMGYAEALTDGQGHKGNRNEIAGKMLDSDFYDQYNPDGGMNRSFKPLWFRTYRYLELTVETKEEPLVIEDMFAEFTAYPFKELASFKSDDNSLDQIWKTGWLTARLCAGETYYDCPYYEQLQYIGDTRIQALISLYVSGDDRLMRNAIEQFRHSQLPEGLTQSRYPSAQPQVIPPFSLYWTNMVYDYWKHREDDQFIKSQLNGVRNVLDWYEKQIDQSGMTGGMDWWNFVDWSFGPWTDQKPIGGVPAGAINGNSSILTLQFVYSLQMAAELFNSYGERDLSARYTALAKKLLTATYERCWDKGRGLLADSPDKNVFSQHANILGVLTGMFNTQSEKVMIDKILNEKGLTEATLYFKFYLVQAMKKAGMSDGYLELLNPWKDMIAMGLSTFAETPEPTRSDCHAWSASPNYDFLATVCGITPGSKGFGTVNIAPQFGTLTSLSAVMPHPKGSIAVNLKRTGGQKLEAEITLPDGIEGQLIWQGKKIKLKPGRQFLSI